MPNLTEQEKSRIILEWAGFKTHESYTDYWLTPDGRLLKKAFHSLYAKENLWILFEYVIPKLRNLTIDYQSNSWAVWIADSGLCENKSLSEALCEAILKALEASREG